VHDQEMVACRSCRDGCSEVMLVGGMCSHSVSKCQYVNALCEHELVQRYLRGSSTKEAGSSAHVH
jgi:hypothetical protein